MELCEFDWAAAGTWAAAVLALWIALRDGRRLKREQRHRTKLATIMLWPDLRRLLAALNKLGKHSILDTAEPMSQEVALDFTRINGLLSRDLDRVMHQVTDLEGDTGLAMARVMANVRHVIRHAIDLSVFNGTLSEKATKEKQAAIRTAIARAKADLVPLIESSKRLKNQEGASTDEGDG